MSPESRTEVRKFLPEDREAGIQVLTASLRCGDLEWWALSTTRKSRRRVSTLLPARRGQTRRGTSQAIELPAFRQAFLGLGVLAFGEHPVGYGARCASRRRRARPLLYTVLAPDGRIAADDRSIEADGSIGWKYPVWRAPGVGEAGDLRISGHELTTGTAIRSVIPDGYGQRFQAGGVHFPGAGCYELTLRSGEASLTFITMVDVADAHEAPAP